MDHELLSAARARVCVWERQGGTCAACGHGMTPDAMHTHHRVRRRDLGWCPCNLVGLHPDCHVVAPQAVHQRPSWARARGLIVPTWNEPRDVPVWLTYPWTAWSLLRCDGLVATDPRGGLPPAHDPA